MRRLAPTLALVFLAGCDAFAGCFYDSIGKPEMLPALEPLPMIGSLSADRCATCHAEIAAEWRTSLMAAATTNPFYRADHAHQHELFLCERCHNPLENQMRDVVDGLASVDPLVGKGHPNPRYDPALEAEGVTCVVCHASAEALGEAPAATMFTGERAADAPEAPHPVALAAALGEHGGMCQRCHQYDPPFVGLPRPPADTHAEYDRYRASGGTASCLDCHMPMVEGRVANASPPRLRRSHRFLGVRDGAFVAEHVEATVEAVPGGVQLVVTNRAGHHVPTADPGRVLAATVTRVSDGQDGPSRTVRFRRDFDPVHLVERYDASLLPLETRRIFVPFAGSGSTYRVTLELFRYEPRHPLALAAHEDREALVTHVATATVSAVTGR